MPSLTPVRVRDKTPVVYPEWRWRLLENLRERALELLRALEGVGASPVVIGSVARGDVTPSSDIDVHFTAYVPSWRVVVALERAGISVRGFRVIQASPSTAIRIIVVVDEGIEISIPVSRLSKTEEEFPKYAGAVSLREIKLGVRVPGVNKRLLFVEPTSYGHDEWSIIGFESEAARLLGISLDTILERRFMRIRRAREGKAGFYVHLEIPVGESPEDRICEAARTNPVIRRAVATVLGC
ncbi:nucleotidyltransferase domain-containing protein [Infirmifilum sp. NZ]|uniref:nucleotidyltransferase domain-containing protein n=1 Tax=Infirmifilum sp. NZ TaxID=2926850 RepID=UPI0027A659CC|nr:nucleotidyltransferase domain-containing protein [Infirmifilum sp. NZ]UNQ72771.1 nucleotidyltransferase domain-containing protein [Infirmifilum sp. NZ]